MVSGQRRTANDERPTTNDQRRTANDETTNDRFYAITNSPPWSFSIVIA